MTMPETYFWLSFAIYIFIMAIGVVYPGIVLFRTGKIFLEYQFANMPSWVSPINNTLLTGYYLLTGGYSFWNLNGWPEINSLNALLETISINTGQIILFMGVFHLFNVMLLSMINNRNPLINQ